MFINTKMIDEFMKKEGVELDIDNISADTLMELIELECESDKIRAEIKSHRYAIKALSERGIKLSKKALELLGVSADTLDKFVDECCDGGDKKVKETTLDPAAVEELNAVLKKHGIVPEDAVCDGVRVVSELNEAEAEQEDGHGSED